MTDTSNALEALEPVLKFLRQYAPFKQMLPVHQEYLAMYLEQVFYAEAEIILAPEDGVVDCFYIIKRGSVSGEIIPGQSGASKSPETLLGAGDCFPITALLNNRAVYFQHQAKKSSICYKLKQTHFGYLMQQSTIFHDFYRAKSQSQYH